MTDAARWENSSSDVRRVRVVRSVVWDGVWDCQICRTTPMKRSAGWLGGEVQVDQDARGTAFSCDYGGR